MTPPNRRRLRPLPALLTLAVMCLPVSGFVWFGALNYYAGFNEVPVQGGTTPGGLTFGGISKVDGQPDIFTLVFPTPQDGEVRVGPNLGSTDAELVCELSVPVEAQTCEIGFSLQAITNFSDFDVRFDDVGDTGILDMQFKEDRHVVIEGQLIPLPLLLGETKLFVKVTLKVSPIGVQTWDLTLNGPTNTEKASGTLNVPTLSLSSIHFVRRAGQVGGIWNLDDVVVTSNDPSYSDFSTLGAVRQQKQQ